jgi:hypothetical protein
MPSRIGSKPNLNRPRPRFWWGESPRIIYVGREAVGSLGSFGGARTKSAPSRDAALGHGSARS